MLLPIIVLFLVTSVRGTFITYRDALFNDEDPRLAEELRRRSNHDALIRTFKPYPVKLKMVEPPPRQPRTAPPSTPAPFHWANATNNYRRYYSYGTSTDHWFPLEVGDRMVRHKQIDLIEQAIYAAQYRIKDVEPIVKKYLDLLEFRMSFIFRRLEMIEEEMEVIYSMLLNDKLEEIFKYAKRRVYEYIVYYEYVLAKHIDVTYMCERVAWLHENGKEQRHLEMKERIAKMQQEKSLAESLLKPDKKYGKDDMAEYEKAEEEKLKKEAQARPSPPAFTKDVPDADGNYPKI